MLKLNKLHIQGIRTFTKKQTFDLSKLSNGLYFITGQNLVEPHLGANDVGKSSIAESLCICFFGKTSCNLRTPDIINWNKVEKSIIACEIEKNGIPYVITRSLSPNKLTLQNLYTNVEEVKTQQDLEVFLECNFNSFLYSTYIAQFTDKFVDLSSPEKMEIFTDFLGKELQIWDTYIVKSKEIVKEIENELQQINNDTLIKQGKLSILQSTNYNIHIQQYNNEKKSFLDMYLIESQNIKNDIANINNEIPLLQQQYDKYNKNKEDLKLKIENSKKLNEGNEIKIKQIDKELVTQGNEKYQYSVKIEKLLNSLESLSISKKRGTALSGSVCPTCTQIVDPKHIENEIAKIITKCVEIENEIISLRKSKQKVEETIVTLNLNRGAYSLHIKNITDEIDKIRTELNVLDRHISEVENRVSQLDTKEKILLQKQNDLDIKHNSYSKENPYIKLEKQHNDSIKAYARSILYNKDVVDNLNARIEINKYWIKGYAEIKLSILENKIKEFELYINSVLNSFGMEKWSIVVNTASETRSGTIKNGLSIFVKSYLNTELVPFECWGGGVGQRLRLACTLGLMSFIQNNINSFDFELFDEPTQFLADQGISDLLDILMNKAITEHKKIFIIDHRGLEAKGLFSGIITITKNEEGSIINENNS